MIITVVCFCCYFVKRDSRVKHSPLPIFKKSSLENLSRPYYSIVNDEMYGVKRDFFELHASKVTYIRREFPILGENICREGLPKFLFAVPSVVKLQAAQDRLEIRQTWASSFYGSNWLQADGIRIAFFFGSENLSSGELESLRNESGV